MLFGAGEAVVHHFIVTRIIDQNVVQDMLIKPHQSIMLHLIIHSINMKLDVK